MSIDRPEVLRVASAALDKFAASIRATGTGDDPGLLHRAGRLATLLESARAAEAEGESDAAALLTATVLREILREFPDAASEIAPELNIVREDALRERIGRAALSRSLAA